MRKTMKISIFAIIILSIGALAFHTHRFNYKGIETNMGTVTNSHISLDGRKVVIDFLLWYKNAYSEISQIVLVNIGDERTTNEPYTINISGCDEYLSFLKQSGFISDKYIEQWSNYFHQQSDVYKITLQTDGPPEGFEYDFILQTQEIDDALKSIDDIKKINLIHKSQNHQTIEVDIPPTSISFDVSCQNNYWEIDKIY